MTLCGSPFSAPEELTLLSDVPLGTVFRFLVKCALTARCVPATRHSGTHTILLVAVAIAGGRAELDGASRVCGFIVHGLLLSLSLVERGVEILRSVPLETVPK
jgi:hypothetical protein